MAEVDLADEEPLGDELGEDLDKDFDAAWANEKPKRVKIKGRVYTLPADIPASVLILLVRQRRAERDGGDGLVWLEQILKGLLGEAGYQQILADGIGISHIRDIVDWCLDVYGLRTKDGQGEAKAPGTRA